ncbi:D-amino acid dehydrogenase [Conchiformibius kuhniae]|uniref:D-amino acid dehydrogenase n=1 Tax=Conchiformibius kuhniae TaxID=211502 RepID=A0A8T9MTD3_9NEIS|nr:D-amino acid dehydrogenase [Conchiformibius kuhniae]UOP04539.1 D-amino acid dehydrogenase [Conchiformibius kuhniae]
MNIVILGAGIAGVSTAYYLSGQGHQVTVLDRAQGVAEETSFANAGQLSFGYTTPWAAPNIPFKALKWLFKEHSPLIIRPDGSLYQLRWLAKMLANCTNAAYARNQARMMRLSEYSRALFAGFERDTGMDFEQRSLGTLHLFRDAAAFAKHQNQMGVLAQFNVPYTVLDAQGCLQHEPALAHFADRIAGAFHLPNDRTGNCRLFAQQLADICRQRGVNFRFGETVTRLHAHGRTLRHAVTQHGEYPADVFVCALGSFSRPVLAQLGLDIPVYPVKGYSITVPLADEAAAPQSTVLDETYKVALTRLGGKMRVGGMAELSGYSLARPPVHRETLTMVAKELFPAAADFAEPGYWTGLRPMTPDSTPIVGAAGFDNLFLNTGHGTLGWTMSLGCAKTLADLITHGKAEIETADLSPARYR